MITYGGVLQKAVLSYTGAQLLMVNGQEALAKAIALWSCGYRSTGKGSRISDWQWKKAKGGKRWMRIQAAWKEFSKTCQT